MGCSVSIGGKLTAHEVSISESTSNGCEGKFGADLVLSSCTVSMCAEHGLHTLNRDTQVEAEGCSLRENGDCGAHITGRATVVMRGCSRSNNRGGYCAGYGAKVRVTNISSDGDGAGCQVLHGGSVLTMEQVRVDGASRSGTLE